MDEMRDYAGNPLPDPYQYWLCRVIHVGLSNRIKCQLLECYSGAKEIYEASEDELARLPFLPEKVRRDMVFGRSSWDLEGEYEKFLKCRVSLVTLDMEGYPAVLRMLCDAPYGMYYRGHIPPGVSDGTARVAAIVGARNCSQYGRLMADEIAAALASQNYIVVSGMARGIDGIAQTGCLNEGGTTVAVLGCGADICYPKQHWQLYDRIIGQGCVMSELPCGTSPLGKFFPARNRLISGMASAVIVVEAKIRSGSLITADFAIEQNKDVYVVPGRITDPMSAGCNELIRKGAHIVAGPGQLLEDLDVIADMGHFQPRENLRYLPSLENDQTLVYHSLDFYPSDIDTIVNRCGLPYVNVMAALTDLIDLGIAKDSSHNQFIKLL